MLQSGVLLKEIDELIRGLDDGTPDGELKSRACALVFLISQLPHDGVGDTGVRATAPVIADLLVEDLAADGARLRKDVPRVLDELVEQGRVMKLGDEFRLQTEEGATVDQGLQPAPRRDPRRRRTDVAAAQRVAAKAGRRRARRPQARARREQDPAQVRPPSGATTSRPATRAQRSRSGSATNGT